MKQMHILRQMFDGETVDPRIVALLEQAVRDMATQGAQIVDPVDIPNLKELTSDGVFINTFQEDLNSYLASLGPDAPIKTLAEIAEAGRYHPLSESGIQHALTIPNSESDLLHKKIAKKFTQLRQETADAMNAANVDALIYPTWNNPPRLIGDLNTPHGNNSWQLSPPTGFPAITVPMGFVDGILPSGLQFLGQAWSEPTLIKIVYGYEQATQHRRAPQSVPPLSVPPLV